MLDQTPNRSDMVQYGAHIAFLCKVGVKLSTSNMTTLKGLPCAGPGGGGGGGLMSLTG